MLAKTIAATTQRECSAETVEEFLARGGRIERIEAHPDPEGRVLLRGSRDSRFGSFVRRTLPSKRS